MSEPDPGRMVADGVDWHRSHAAPSWPPAVPCRALALRFHPDKSRSGGSAAARVPPAAAEALFKLAAEAHSVLGDPEARRAHDLLALRFKYRRFGAA